MSYVHHPTQKLLLCFVKMVVLLFLFMVFGSMGCFM